MYEDYPVKPYISPERDLATEEFKPVPKKNMELLEDDLLAGDIILLWRIAFDTFTNESWFPKYFEYTYGINAPKRLDMLLDKGYAQLETAFASLDHINATKKKKILKDRGVAGLSKMKAADLEQALKDNLSEDELGNCFTVRGILLTEKGQAAIDANPQVIDRHPKKKY
ncbi:hypothetical protein J2T50_000019 [Streptococcus gallinaceus]|uniref:hypothetical protein n=1 Tax=Streptococcus gallinaceus TaxID=165758 RepID=UPI00209DBEBD|nr:hypothetical protein [Streptococcus gallinaceus]MCP1638326.1 hypothetical protein [Streptococcus gallinaceus]MCP1769587.1 hypothetical protein [Streptococcus gallinaceus]